jgi:type IV pilus assembly protein PilO
MAIGANMTKREQTLAAIGFMAVMIAGAYWYFLYKPKAAELAVVQAHVDSLDKRNQQARADIAQGSLQKLRAQSAEYEQSLRVMRQLVPRSNEVPALLEDMSTAARRVGLDLATVEPMPVLPGEQFDTYRYKLAVIGGYHAVGQFLSNVGSLNRIIAPVTLAIRLQPAAARTKARVKAGSCRSGTTMKLPIPFALVLVAAVATGAATQSRAAAPVVAPTSRTTPLPAPATTDTTQRVLINRESFQYDADGRRDPFVSLLTTADLRPLLSDLKLVAVAFYPNGRSSVAVMRDITSKEQYRVRVGQTLGRMRVAAIQEKAVIFTIEEFGFSRQELLAMTADSTKTRRTQ